jgi:hypothetical protein
MPKTKRDTRLSLRLLCDDSNDNFIVRYSNQGEPFREGVEIGVENREFEKEVIVTLIDGEARQLRDLLIRLYPINIKG